LQAGGAKLIAPVRGLLACGEDGVGAMAEPQTIADALG